MERELRPRSDHSAMDLGASLRVEGVTFQPPSSCRSCSGPRHTTGRGRGPVTPTACGSPLLMDVRLTTKMKDVRPPLRGFRDRRAKSRPKKFFFLLSRKDMGRKTRSVRSRNCKSEAS
jgi:hypothetical protein